MCHGTLCKDDVHVRDMTLTLNEVAFICMEVSIWLELTGVWHFMNAAACTYVCALDEQSHIIANKVYMMRHAVNLQRVY